MPEQPTDKALLQRMSQKQPDAFDSFYDRHIQTIYNLVFRIIGERRMADDIVEKLFWQVWQNADRYIEADENHEQSGIPVWLYHLAHSKSVERQRHLHSGTSDRQAWAPDLNKDLSTSNSLIDWDSLHPLRLRTSLDPKRLLATLDTLPPEQRQCLELAYFDNLTQEQIAERLGTPVEIVKSWLSQGLIRLTELFDSTEIGYI